MQHLPDSAEVVIVGGGIVGLCIAVALAEAGVRPLLLEARAFGAAVTGGSLAALGVHMHGIPEFQLMRHSCALWRAAAAQGPGFEYAAQGQLGFILTPEAMESGEDWISEENALGAGYRLLTPAEVQRVEPRLTGPVLGATFAPDTATVNPFLAARAMLQRARAAGATALAGVPVRGVEVAGGRVTGVTTDAGRVAADTVILAAGPWTQDLAGGAVPLVPRQAQCLASLRQPRGTITRVVSAVERKGGVDSGYTQIQQSASGQILFNTVIQPVEAPPDARDRIREAPPGFVVSSIDMLLHLFPSLGALSLLRSWVRFEAVSPDARFLAGRFGPEGLWLCAGDNGSGFCRAPMLGQFLAGEITGRAGMDGALRADARRLYDPGRFAEAAA